jgi:hypothetical protein
LGTKIKPTKKVLFGYNQLSNTKKETEKPK